MKDYKDSLLMMKTDFPMRGNLGVNEHNIQKFWDDNDLYHKVLEKNKGQKAFYLHDGPPYANGNIHIGHAENKVLKDFLVRYKTMNGYYSPYVPGWDTHGLPIENALTKNKKINRKELSISEFRSLCRDYALEQVEIQKNGFKRLGVLGEWDHPYITLEPHFEAEQLRAFGIMAKRGLIFKGLKPVYWSPSSETALAEAEVEYQDVTSASIYVAFPVVDGKGVLNSGDELVIWTTTPWTLPANLAICANGEFEYSVVNVNGHHYVIASELLENVSKTIGFENYVVEKKINGASLEGITYHHVFLERISPVILGEHVTLDAGTGLVHTAPGHGEDDFIVGKKYNLDILCPVDSKGFMMQEAGEFAGLFYEKANDAILNKLTELGVLLKRQDITHSYPHDWRTHKPIIFRATAQWFASIESFKEDILKEIHNIEWSPAWGEVRMTNMIKDRGDWCISRQRVWGVPIPVFYAEDGSAILDVDVINHVADIVEEKGTNAWFDLSATELLPNGFTHPGSPNGIFTKETDIMDVWFDSGTSHQTVMTKDLNVYPADVYLEGSDQYRGWFNSSLITGVALNGKAPYKTVISHGWTLDGNGQKMSKSLGNTIDPVKVCNESGADIFRLLIASIDYHADARLSKDLIKQISEAYRKIRNTYRFLLGNLFDFDPTKDKVVYEKLGEIDKYILCRLNEVIEEVHTNYQKYEFDEVYRNVLNFMTNELSAFYLDFTKDILYIEESDNVERRSIQTVFYECLKSLVLLMTPILPHTAEEVYKYMPKEANAPISVYLLDMPIATKLHGSEDILKRYNKFMTIRSDILKALEMARNEKIIGKSLVAKLTFKPTQEVKNLLDTLKISFAKVFIVSEYNLTTDEIDGYQTESGIIKVELMQGETCSRCWQTVHHIDENELCPRCSKIIAKTNFIKNLEK